MGLMLATFVGLTLTTATGQQKKYAEDPPGPDNHYHFTEPTPAGEWLFRTANFDIEQTNDPSVPAVIAGIRLYTGTGEWRKHLMIESLVLKSRVSIPVTQIRLAWIINKISNEGSSPRMLLEGQTGIIETGLTTVNGRTKPFYFEVLKAARPLIKDGELNGTFEVRVRLIEARFRDGTSWKQD